MIVHLYPWPEAVRKVNVIEWASFAQRWKFGLNVLLQRRLNSVVFIACEYNDYATHEKMKRPWSSL